MNTFHIFNWYSSFGLMFSITISFIQPTLKRKIAVLCLFISSLSPLLAYGFYTERLKMPGFPLWLDAAISAFSPLASILAYQWSKMWIRKIEDMKQRSAKRAAYIESLRFKEGEEPA